MRQEFADTTSLLCRQSGQDIFDVFKRIMPVQLGGLDQAHDCSRPLAGAQAAGEEPVLAIMEIFP